MLWYLIWEGVIFNSECNRLRVRVRLEWSGIYNSLYIIGSLDNLRPTDNNPYNFLRPFFNLLGVLLNP